MTEVYAERDGNRFLLVCKGHATGSEQVCAGISAIVYALTGWLMSRQNDDHTHTLEDGYSVVRFSGGEAERVAFDMAVIGLRQIEAGYGSYICVTEKIIL